MDSVQTGYLAAPGYEWEVIEELGAVEAVYGRLVLAEGPPRPCAWAQNVWLDPRRVPIRSIQDAARQLRALQRDWALYSWTLHRRGALITAELPKLRTGAWQFGMPRPVRAPGSWTLLDAHTLLAAPQCSSPFPHGEVSFAEDREAPPNRAYLKLWELFTLLGQQPGPGERCLDLGASPGGWTWVLASLGARVLAVDRAPLAPEVARLPGVAFLRGSAFGLDPQRWPAAVPSHADLQPPFDWVFSDVACYPTRLFTLVERWLRSGAARRLVCTIKFQGATDLAISRRFTDLAGMRLVHLWHNKHELTAVWPGSAPAGPNMAGRERPTAPTYDWGCPS